MNPGSNGGLEQYFGQLAGQLRALEPALHRLEIKFDDLSGRVARSEAIVEELKTQTKKELEDVARELEAGRKEFREIALSLSPLLELKDKIDSSHGRVWEFVLMAVASILSSVVTAVIFSWR